LIIAVNKDWKVFKIMVKSLHKPQGHKDNVEAQLLLFCSLCRDKIFFLPQNVHTVFGMNPASYSMDTGALRPGVKWPGNEVDLSPPARVKVKSG
jgi:hypothetical protein